MHRYIAFLRAINVGGRFIKMDALAAHFASLGFSEVRTFISSGNVIFESPEASAEKLSGVIESALAALLGFKSETFVRSVEEFQDVAKHARAYEIIGDGNVAFLNAPLNRDQIRALDSIQNEDDRFEQKGREVYWLSRCSQGASKFSNAVFNHLSKVQHD